MEGWIFTAVHRPHPRDGFDLVVTSDEGENLRQAPNGPVVGRAREGTLLERVGQQGQVDPGPAGRVGAAAGRAVAGDDGPAGHSPEAGRSSGPPLARQAGPQRPRRRLPP